MDAPELHLRPELLAAGFADDEVRRLVRAGRLAPLRRGVHVGGVLPDDVAARHVVQWEVRAAGPVDNRVGMWMTAVFVLVARVSSRLITGSVTSASRRRSSLVRCPTV